MTDLTPFARIYARAAKRKGGKAALESLLPAARSARALTRVSDDRILAEMTRAVFNAGFNWSVVRSKWDGFESAFEEFEPARIARWSDARLSALLQDTRVVRNRTKIYAVRENALLVASTSKQHRGFGRFLAGWPDHDLVGLLDTLKANGSRLGGHTGQYFLRSIGKDTFVTSRDVVKVLVAEGVVSKEPSTKSDMRRVQDAFNAWAEQSGRPLCQISRVLACSTD